MEMKQTELAVTKEQIDRYITNEARIIIRNGEKFTKERHNEILRMLPIQYREFVTYKAVKQRIRQLR